MDAWAPVFAWVLIIGLPLAIVLLYGVAGFDLQRFAWLGDALGSVALVAALVAVGLQLLALRVMQQDLELNRKELADIAATNRATAEERHRAQLRDAYSAWIAAARFTWTEVSQAAGGADQSKGAAKNIFERHRPELDRCGVLVDLVEPDPLVRAWVHWHSRLPTAKERPALVNSANANGVYTAHAVECLRHLDQFTQSLALRLSAQPLTTGSPRPSSPG